MMHTQVKEAYDRIYVDVQTKKRILSNLETMAMRNEFIEDDQPKMKANQRIETVKVALNTSKTKQYHKIIAMAASFGVVITLAIVGVNALSGGPKQPDPNINATAVSSPKQSHAAATAKPSETVATPKPTVTAATAKPTNAPATVKPKNVLPTPKPTKTTPTSKPEKTVKSEDGTLTISEREFRDGIEKMKKIEDTSLMPNPIFATKDLVIINHFKGMLFFDTKEQKAMGVLNTEKYNINHFESEDSTDVKVSVKGDLVSFRNTISTENTYLYNVSKRTLQKGVTLDDNEVGSYTKSVDDKMLAYLKKQLGDQYVFSDMYAEVVDGLSVLCGVKITGKSSNNDFYKKGDLVIIQLKRGAAQGAKDNLSEYFSCEVFEVK